MFSNKEYILTIYNEGSFSKAANKLYISQPSLSASVKRIEEKVSVPLFDRSTTPISLTEAGQEYVKYALEIKEREQDFERYISDYT
ncbi:MAG: LysR family transcriptional regulator, partial [Clostridia bacterium]|nr:LysR family transcriptional regulator [Clostridia bacterium]